MTDLRNLKIENAIRWANAKITRNFVSVAKALVDPEAKRRYKSVSAQTEVPWAVIAVIHEREAGQRWHTQLGQGDPLDRVSIHIPKGRGPFSTWEEGAFDALVNCAPHAAHWSDWTIGGALTLLETYNGLGYADGPHNIETGKTYPPQASPYIWAGTDQYKSGKYVRDRVFDPNVIDSQLGCAGLLKTMMVMDRSISFGASIPVVPAPAPIPSPRPVHPIPPIASGQKTFITWLMELFGRQ